MYGQPGSAAPINLDKVRIKPVVFFVLALPLREC
jgi:hypothetical protein